jgi:hypothetical protein
LCEDCQRAAERRLGEQRDADKTKTYQVKMRSSGKGGAILLNLNSHCALSIGLSGIERVCVSASALIHGG